jgi:hypothetical protein
LSRAQDFTEWVRHRRTPEQQQEWGDELREEDWEQYDQSHADRFIPPTVPPAFEPPPPPPRRVELRGRRLQVIVKLASIHLTPDKPRYPGGAWHVEGMQNEGIVATGIYYFDSHNITESRLAFRQAVREPDYEQGDDYGCRHVYGLGNEEALSQPVGSVSTVEGRCLAFPNTYQHKVAPFELENASRPGHRKIVCFFLIDPSKPILSTAHVPPQQKSWYLEELKRTWPVDPNILRTVLSFMDWWVGCGIRECGGGVRAVPAFELAISQAIFRASSVVVPFGRPMSRAEAEVEREALMEERKYQVDDHNEFLFERPFSLCEH